MGIDPLSLNERQRQLIAPTDRKQLGRAGMTVTAGHERMVRRLERDEQNLLMSWLSLREEDGVLVYDCSRTDRKTTNRKGIPDFRIYRGTRALLGEMKIEDGRLSGDQVEMIEKFNRAGAEVQIWRSAKEAIEKIRDWLTHG
jgi:VRR-NUC domain-containing protein